MVMPVRFGALANAGVKDFMPGMCQCAKALPEPAQGRHEATENSRF